MVNKQLFVIQHAFNIIFIYFFAGTLHFIKELANITKHSGKNVTLRCEVKEIERNQTKSKIQFKWLQNYAEIKENAKFRIKNKVNWQISLDIIIPFLFSLIRLWKVSVKTNSFYDHKVSKTISI